MQVSKALFVMSFIVNLCITLSCSLTKNQFGLTELANTSDTTFVKQEIQRIRSLSNDLFNAATFVGSENIAIKYRLFIPDANSITRKLPLVVVFHGSGAIGNDNISHLGLLAKLFAQPGIQQKYPAYVLAPQFSTRSSDYVMDGKRNVLTSTPRECLNSALLLIDSLKNNLNVDTDRIYAVGYSMGGSTVINALSLRQDLFAAGISIAGIPQFDKIDTIRNIPVWLIHGIEDTENPIESDDLFYKELSPYNKIRFWRLKNTTHDNIFSTTLLGDALPQWLFRIVKTQQNDFE